MVHGMYNIYLYKKKKKKKKECTTINQRVKTKNT